MRKLVLALTAAAGVLAATDSASALDYTCLPERYEVGEVALDRPLCLGGWNAPVAYGSNAYAYEIPGSCRLVREQVSTRSGRVITRTRQVC